MRSATRTLGVLLVTLTAGAVAAGSLDVLPAQAASPAQIQAAAQAPAPAPDRGEPATLAKHCVEIQPGVFVTVHGPRERRMVRYARWIQLLTGDRLAVFEAEGYPLYRHFELYAGERTEHWTYPEKGITYIFEDGVLKRTQPF